MAVKAVHLPVVPPVTASVETLCRLRDSKMRVASVDAVAVDEKSRWTAPTSGACRGFLQEKAGYLQSQHGLPGLAPWLPARAGKGETVCRRSGKTGTRNGYLNFFPTLRDLCGPCGLTILNM